MDPTSALPLVHARSGAGDSNSARLLTPPPLLRRRTPAERRPPVSRAPRRAAVDGVPTRIHAAPVQPPVHLRVPVQSCGNLALQTCAATVRVSLAATTVLVRQGADGVRVTIDAPVAHGRDRAEPPVISGFGLLQSAQTSLLPPPPLLRPRQRIPARARPSRQRDRRPWETVLRERTRWLQVRHASCNATAATLARMEVSRAVPTGSGV